MPTTVNAYATPEVLRWARETAGLEAHEAARKIGVQTYALMMAEEGSDWLTLRQAEKAADVYERPLALLFREEPPQEEEQQALFRRLPGAPELPWPSEMRLLARRIRQRQDAAAELYEDLDESAPWVETARRVKRLAGLRDWVFAEEVRMLLGVTMDTQRRASDSSGYGSLNMWRSAVEGVGVLVMQDGSMEVQAMRGFAAEHPAVPAIVMNSRDLPRARAFTILHELAHLLYAIVGYPRGQRREAAANQLAADIMMPADAFREAFKTTAPHASALRRVDLVSGDFGVTSLAAAIRAKSLSLIPPGEEDHVFGTVRARRPRQRSESGGGGDYYRLTVSRLGPAFINLVFSALDTQTLTYPAASALLGRVNVSNFGPLRDHLRDRATPE